MNTFRLSLLVVVLASATSPALAHTGGGAGTSFLSGFLHPLSGADHILAMIAVGLWARLTGGRALVAFPASFLSAMLFGGIMAMAGPTLPTAEVLIASSVLVLWAAIILTVRPPLMIGSSICAVSALVHGFAHGAEMAPGSTAAPYALGFLLAAGSLLLCGSRLPRLGLGIRQYEA